MPIDKCPERKPLPACWRRWPPRGVVTLLMLLGSSFLAVWSVCKRDEWRGRDELAEVIARTDEADPRWRWEQMRADLEPIPDDENSMRVIEKVAAFRPGRWAVKVGEGEQPFDHRPPPNRRLDDRHVAALRGLLAQNEDCVALAASLKDHPRGRAAVTLSPAVWDTRVPHRDHCREAAYVLNLDAERRLHEGRFDLVGERILALSHAGAALRDDGFFTSQLSRQFILGMAVDRAERLLAHGDVGDDACRRLQEHFAARRSECALLDALRGERAFHHEYFESLDAGRTSLADCYSFYVCRPPATPQNRAAAFAYRHRLPEDHAFLLARYLDAVAIARQPPEKQWPLWLARNNLQWFTAPPRGEFRCVLAVGTLRDVARVWAVSLMRDARVSCLVVALAAERYRLAHGRWPRSQADLCPAFLAAPLVDPTDATPLRLKPWADGVVVYSLGADGRDDGGVNLEVSQRAGADVGVRLYDPDRRGLPAEPRGEDEAKRRGGE